MVTVFLFFFFFLMKFTRFRCGSDGTHADEMRQCFILSSFFCLHCHCFVINKSTISTSGESRKKFLFSFLLSFFVKKSDKKKSYFYFHYFEDVVHLQCGAHKHIDTHEECVLYRSHANS